MHATIVTDLGFGGAGKGSVIDWLARRSDGRTLTVRHNGGPQARHTVVTPDGASHTFSSFGANLLVDNARFYASKFMRISPEAMDREAFVLHREHGVNAYASTWIDAEAMIVTPWHKAAQQTRELKRAVKDAQHGCAGLGTGEVSRMAEMNAPTLRAGDLGSADDVIDILVAIRNWTAKDLGEDANILPPEHRAVFSADKILQSVIEYYTGFGQRLASRIVTSPAAALEGGVDEILFEGAGGVLVDEDVGFHPNTAYATTTPAGALALLDEWNLGIAHTSIGVSRSYAWRHGPGPLPSQTSALGFDEPHNPANKWQGEPRVGWFDAALLSYALDACDGAIDVLGLTHLDVVGRSWPVVSGYVLPGEQPTPLRLRPASMRANKAIAATRSMYLRHVRCLLDEVTGGPDAFVSFVGEYTQMPVWLRSTGPTAADKTTAGMAVGGLAA